MSGKEWQIFAHHARECISRVMDYTQSGETQFLANRMTQDAVLRNLEIIGQCIKDAGVDQLSAKAPNVDWRGVADFRNVLAHAYLTVSPARVWHLIEHELGPLDSALEKLLVGWHP